MRRTIAALTLLLLFTTASADAGWGRRYRTGRVVYQSPQVLRYAPRYQPTYRTYSTPQPVRYIQPATRPTYVPSGGGYAPYRSNTFPPPPFMMMGD